MIELIASAIAALGTAVPFAPAALDEPPLTDPGAEREDVETGGVA
jgi:hypothetical protein